MPRQALNDKYTGVHLLSLHAYSGSVPVSASVGFSVFAKAVADESRSNTPGDFNALIVYTTLHASDAISDALNTVNEHCPIKCLVEAQRIAKSLATLENDKFVALNESQKSLEWQVLDSTLSLPALRSQFYDDSRALLTDEGKGLITTIDDSLAELEQLKAARDSALSETMFEAAEYGLTTQYFAASSAAQLANNISQLGDDNQHWAITLFVGSADALAPIRELFGA